jgi:hypothetical protein
MRMLCDAAGEPRGCDGDGEGDTDTAAAHIRHAGTDLGGTDLYLTHLLHPSPKVSRRMRP